MLPLSHLFENYDLAREALRRWPHDEENLTEMLGYFRISANAVYPFSLEGKTCFLRLAPVGEKSWDNLRGEIEFIAYLREHDFPAMEPLPTLQGELCLLLHTRWGDYYASAFRRVQGEAVEDTDYAPAVMTAYGRALATLHSLSRSYQPTVRKWTHEDALSWAEETLRTYNAPACALRHWERLCTELARLPRTKENYGLVHYDFEPDNVFYDADADRCSVIDFDDGMYHWYALDIAQVLDALMDELPEDVCAEKQAAFLTAYREICPFSAQEEATLPLMRKFVTLYGYARLLHCLADEPAENPDWLIQLREKLQRALSAKEASLQD